VPGIRTSAPGISPAKIAIASMVTMAARAGTGSMKNVTGTSKAVAMVAVRPGIAPTNKPYRAEMQITINTYGCNINETAVRMFSILLPTPEAPR
jgi:hypothetical protein